MPPTGNAQVDELFARDRYLLRQKHLAINEKYAVWDENGTPLMFVERPAHLLRNLLALCGALLAGGTLFALVGFTYREVPESIRDPFLILGIPLAIAAIIAVYIMLEQKRHVEFYSSEAKTRKVLRVIQDTKVQLMTATYSVTDGKGSLIGTFRKNHLRDIFRKQWECRDSQGRLLFIAREDSVLKSLLRRLFGPLLGLLRLNFIFCDPESGVVVGGFNRSFTILDRYVLDLSQDLGRQLDRRLALAMAVMLDTGERR
jgi:hypothetical protein